jgi:hypothetical protein
MSTCTKWVCAWLLWRGIAPIIPDTPPEGAAVVQSFEAEEECQRTATIKRSTRKAVILRGAPAYEVFTCVPAGADPARSHFE